MRILLINKKTSIKSDLKNNTDLNHSEINAGDVIFRECDLADQIFVILSGEVQLTLHGEALTTEGEGGVI